MGNSNSQTISRFTPTQLNGIHTKERHSKKQATKFANPENRVLPIASGAVQRLRSTDNGNILQSGGTISGRKSNIHSNAVSEPEFLQLLQKKGHPLPKPQGHEPLKTLYGHRKSHSDPDIVRMMMCDNDSDDEDDDHFESGYGGNNRSIIAVSPSKAKIKSRKKTRAPEPPHSNTLPRSFDRLPVNYSSDGERKKSFRKKNDTTDTPRRPLPPIPPEELPPPPPPPPPDYNQRDDRGLIKSHSKNYEKNRRMIEKWKFSKPVGESPDESKKRNKSADSPDDVRSKPYPTNVRNEFLEQNNPSRIPNGYRVNDIVTTNERKPSQNELQTAIADAAKKRAERIERNMVVNPSSHAPIRKMNGHIHTTHQQLNERNISAHIDNRKQYYYTDSAPIKQLQRAFSPQQRMRKAEDNEKQPLRSDNKNGRSNQATNVTSTKRKDKKVNSKKQYNWDVFLKEPRHLPDASHSSCSSTDDETEIDLQLRPTLPRRPIELPRFSPTDAWKCINLDFFKSHQQRSDLSSDEGEEVLEDKIQRVNRPVAPRRLIHDRSADSGISPDAGSPMPHTDSFDNLLNGNISHPHRTTPPAAQEDSPNTWIPQQDLVDDSDSGSDHLLPKSAAKRQLPFSQPKFSLPNLMFPSRSLPRTEQKTGYFDSDMCTSDKEKPKNRGRRKKSYRNAEGQHFNSLRNLKKALGLRSRNPITVDNTGLDSNWSLSRSLPNFRVNVKSDDTKQKIKSTPYTAIDAIRRSNSESRTLVQGNTENTVICHSQKQIPSQSPWNLSHHLSPFNKQADGHIIYLPEYSSTSRKPTARRTEDLHVNTDSELVVKRPNNRKKFSYQSTVRQEEKKKLEEQLSKEVEANERQRQKEIEWMNKVEDEFRKQRDKEKVNIRHQLRILNLQEKSFQKVNDDLPDNHDETKLTSTTMNSPLTKNEINGCHPPTTTSFGSSPSDVRCENRKPTGMKKWLKRQNRHAEGQGMGFVRPEPEGGRSSSDDCRQQDCKTNGHLPRSHSHGFPDETKLSSKCTHDVDASCSRCVHLGTSSSGRESSDISKTSPSPEMETPIRSMNGICKIKDSRQSHTEKSPSYPAMVNGHTTPFNKPEMPETRDDYRFIKESVEEYEMHTSLCRTNSGRTFESHSYYAVERHKENNETKPRNNVFSTTNFDAELKENVRKDCDKRMRKPPPRDYESDDSINESNGIRYQRPGGRNPRKKKDTPDSREPSFSRNHPHRSAARKISQTNGCHTNGKLTNFKSTSNDILMTHHRLSSSVLG